jgi:hypothetical protein
LNWSSTTVVQPAVPVVGVGVAAEVGVGVRVGVGFGVGVAAEVGVGVRVGVGFGVAVATDVGRGVAVGPAVGGAPTAVGDGLGVALTVLLTMKDVVNEAVPLFVTTFAVILWFPVGIVAVFQGMAPPDDFVPAKSKGAWVTLRAGVPRIEVLSSQKLTFVTPVVGVRNM